MKPLELNKNTKGTKGRKEEEEEKRTSTPVGL
jgi:hypothetical protein